MTNEILTQTAEWTQMGDEDDDLIPNASQCESMVPNSPRHRPPPPPPQPWGRLMPCSSTEQITQLFPRSPLYKYNTSHHHTSSSSQGAGMVSMGVHPTAFLRTVQPCDIFNVHFIGRSAKCDIPVKNPSILSIGSRSHMTQTTATSTTTTTMDKKIMARQEWCYGMISNRHCKIYCTVDALALTNADVQDHDTDEEIAHKLSSSLQVWVEDCSGNGTIINGTTVLMKGDKRLLHSGDEICLVQQHTLQKKVVSRTELQHLLHEYSFVFVNCVTNHRTPRLLANTVPVLLPPPPPLSHGTTTNDMMVPKNDHYGSRTKRKPAVDVRATKSTRIRPSLEPPPPLTILSDHGMINDRTSKRRTSLSHDYFGDNTNLSQPPTTTTTPSNTRRISPRRQQPRRVQEDYDIRDVLGSGTMGEVRRAIHRRTGQAVAIKVIPIKRTKNGHNTATNKNCNDSKNTMMISTTTTMEIEMEALILQKLQHPYIVKLMDVYMCPTAVYLVMELVQGGDLFDRIIQKGNYTEIDTRRVMRRLLAAVHYLHESSGYGIVHRDLKPENILLTSHASDIDVKLTDFGLAKQDGDLKTFCGTPQYFAPEVLRRRHTVKGNGRYGKQADMWSLGVILYVLLTGSPPFDSDDNHPQAMLSSQSNGGGGDGDPMPLYFPSHISVAAQDMVRQLLQYDPKKRASIVSACVHEWILQDDGDTHIHPLDDPKLQTDGSVRGTVSIPITQKVTTPSIPDIPITTALEKTFALDASPTRDVSKTTDSTRKIATSAENFSFKKDLCDHHSRHRSSVMDHGSPPRTPLLPVIITKTPIVPPPPDCHNATTFSKTTLHHVPTNHITPATELNNFSNVNVAPSDNVTSDTAIHLTTNQRRVHANVDNDDDIMSRFSENTESVGSFSTANTYSEVAVKQIDTDQTNQTSINAVEIKSKSLLSKKKRSLSNVSPSSRKNFTSGKTVKQSNRHRMDASAKTRSSAVKKKKTTRFRTNPIIASPSLLLPPSHVPVVQHDATIHGKKITTNGDGRKQLTLNNWFKKHN